MNDEKKYYSALTGMSFTKEDLDAMAPYQYDPESDKDDFEQRQEWLMAYGLETEEYDAFEMSIYGHGDGESLAEGEVFEDHNSPFDDWSEEDRAEYEDWLNRNHADPTSEELQSMYIQYICDNIKLNIPDDPDWAWAYNAVAELQSMDRENVQLGFAEGEVARHEAFITLKEELAPLITQAAKDGDEYGFRDEYDDFDVAVADTLESLKPSDYGAVMEFFKVIIEEENGLWLEDGSALDTLRTAKELGLVWSDEIVDLVNLKLEKSNSDYIAESFIRDAKVESVMNQADHVARRLEAEGYLVDVDMRDGIPAYLNQELGDKNPDELYADVTEYDERFHQFEQEVFDEMYQAKHYYGFDEQYFSNDLRGMISRDYTKYDNARLQKEIDEVFSVLGDFTLDFTKDVVVTEEMVEMTLEEQPVAESEASKSYDSPVHESSTPRRVPEGYEDLSDEGLSPKPDDRKHEGLE